MPIHNFDIVHDRRGTYCTQWDYIQDRFGKPGILPFSISDTDFTTPEPIVRKVTDVASRGLYGYTRWNHHDFKGAVADWFLRRYSASIVEDWVLYSPSVMYSVSLLVRLLTKTNQGVLSLNPMYDSFPGAITGNRRHMVTSTLVWDGSKFVMNFDELEKLAPNCGMFLLCSPHNPTGRIWTREELTKVISLCSRHNLWLVTDEIHADINLCGRPHISGLDYIDTWSKIITVSSASKTFNTPALGGSYLIIPDTNVREAFINHTRHVDFLNSATVLGMHATITGYRECDYYVDQLCEYIRGNMRYLKEWLQENYPQIRFEIPDGTYLAWMDVSRLGYSTASLQNALVNVGEVGIMRGDTYGSAGEGYLRMCIGCPRSKLEEGLIRIGRGIEWLRGESSVQG